MFFEARCNTSEVLDHVEEAFDESDPISLDTELA